MGIGEVKQEFLPPLHPSGMCPLPPKAAAALAGMYLSVGETLSELPPIHPAIVGALSMK